MPDTDAPTAAELRADYREHCRLAAEAGARDYDSLFRLAGEMATALAAAEAREKELREELDDHVCDVDGLVEMHNQIVLALPPLPAGRTSGTALNLRVRDLAAHADAAEAMVAALREALVANHLIGARIERGCAHCDLIRNAQPTADAFVARVRAEATAALRERCAVLEQENARLYRRVVELE